MVFFLLYLATAQRTVSWQDSGHFQWRVLEGDYSGDLGLALAHPLYIAAGRGLAFISRQRLPFLLNAFSGLGMAVALANLAALGTMLSGRRWAGLLTAGMLGLCHTAWWLSTIAEVYTWSAAGLTAELCLLVILIRRPGWGKLAALAFLSGLGLCVHNFALLAMPVYVCVAVVLVLRRRLGPWSLAVAAAAYLLGAGMYLGMIAELALRNHDVVGAVRSALVGDYARQVVNVAAISKHLKYNAALSGMNFLNPLLPLAVLGWVRFRRRLGGGLAGALGAITLIHVLFFVRYPVPDQFTFILPTLVMIAAAASVGLGEVARWGRRRRLAVVVLCCLCLLAQPVFFAVAPSLAKKSLGRVRKRQLPFRDEIRYWLVPWKHNERSARQFCRTALRQAEPNAIIMPGSTSLYPLLVTRNLERLRPDVTIQDDSHPLPGYRLDPAAFRSALGDRPLYVDTNAPGYVPPKLLEDAELRREKENILYRVHWHRP